MRTFRGLFLCATAFLLFGCGKSSSESNPVPTRPVTAESDVCVTTQTVSSGTTLTATAQYEARQVSISGLGAAGAPQPIRFAEVIVVNSAGTTIQCGVTNASGALVGMDFTTPLKIPATANSYTVKVRSRGLNSKVQVSIVNNPYDNVPYEITGTFSLVGGETSKAVSLTTAPATGALQGGAFNIFDKIYAANEFLRNNSTCPSAPASEVSACSVFTVAPKIKVFWSPGVDPGTTLLGLSYAISAYLRDTTPTMKGLYILGGKNGDSDCFDTDHFDNSVILHEYGHYLEEAYAFSNSPGGSHNGNAVIDPRLAWSEGWSNFFQAAVLGDKYYRDTNRNSSCAQGTQLLANLTLDEKKNFQDVPYATSEGNYREISVTRTLYQAMVSSAASTKQANLGFPLIWRAFASTANGIAKTSDKFRYSGIYNQHLYSLTQASEPGKLAALVDVFNYEKQEYNNTSYYYSQTVTEKSCATYPFTITGGSTYTVSSSTGLPIAGTSATPSLQKDNHFYRLDWGGGLLNLSLVYKFTASPRPDLDLYFYKESHVLFEKSTMLASSAQVAGQEQFDGTNYLETVSVSFLPAGTYFIHVSMDESSNYDGVSVDYMLRYGSGGKLCP